MGKSMAAWRVCLEPLLNCPLSPISSGVRRRINKKHNACDEPRGRHVQEAVRARESIMLRLIGGGFYEASNEKVNTL